MVGFFIKYDIIIININEFISGNFCIKIEDWENIMYSKIDKRQYTPMMRQYLEIKEQHSDAIVFFRLGDFYEMFFNDAIVAAKELEIVLTSRDAGATDRVPMCGVPYHSVNGYLDRLTEKGYKVAIVEQTEDPSQAQGIVRREVVRIITPGTVTDSENLDTRANNFLVCLSFEKDRFILSYSDLATGENYLTNLPPDDELLRTEILKLKTREIVVGPKFNINILKPLTLVYAVTFSQEDRETPLDYLRGLCHDLDKAEGRNFWRLMNYIVRTQKRNLIHLKPVERYDSDAYLKIDFTSRRNLELIETLRFQDKKNTLLAVLDKCVTAMGSRYLKKALLFPLIERDQIERRYDIIDCIAKYFLEADDLKAALAEVYDLERIVGRISYENASPRDLLQLKRSLSVLPKIIELTTKIKINDYFDLVTDYQNYADLCGLIEKAIADDAPYLVRDGNVIKEGFNSQLDELRIVQSESKDYLLSLELKERKRTGIKNLKVGYNRVFGYYIEVSKGASAQVKTDFGYIRKQTLSNSERFITQELKEKEAQILRADEKALKIEIDLFHKIRNQCKAYIASLQRLARILAELDMMLAFTKSAKENNYVRPRLNNDNHLEMKNLRHPVLERTGTDFIPNDVKMTSDDYILLITGPNMSGKSTYMRQIALAAVMAQIGSFVAADRARLPVFDAVFTRIGAADDIVSGKSTFMVEMTEVNKALSAATKRSLILLDEIGRGTATYDGMALAQAILEYINEYIGGKTLFSTHYHELTTLEEDLLHLRNVHVAAEEVDGDIVFLYKVRPGAVDKSYGINVAKLASLPLEVILRAGDILKKLETHKPDRKVLSRRNYQPPLLFDSKTEKETIALNKIKTLDLYNISPLDALCELEKIQMLLKK